MFIITNRKINEEARGLKRLGDRPNPRGPNELRLVEANKKAGRWSIKILPDEITPAMKREVGLERARGAVYASRYVAKTILDRVRSRKKNLLFFVHGFNNDVEAVLERSAGLARNYGVEVVAFSWPANGGGVKGVLDYKSDKRDARASVGALDRCLMKIHELLGEFNQELLKDASRAAERRYPNNAELRDDYITRLSERGCPFTVNMMVHSMGAYLFKHVLKSSIYRGTRLTFDNVAMVAADANNENHTEWADKIHCRGRIYITINENDRALLASRVKSGQEQLPRLGHYPHNLDSTRAIYVEFTGAPRVGRSHAYFEGSPTRNAAVKRFFRKAFNGERAEQGLDYNARTGTHRIKRGR